MSTKQRKKKTRYRNLTPEMSEKLRKSHTLKGYKEKYGEELGGQKYGEMKINCSLSKTLNNFIKIYGENEGRQKHKQFVSQQSTKMRLNNFIKIYGKSEGKRKHEQFIKRNKESNTLKYYKEKHGEKEGIKKWEQKNIKNSLSSMKLLPADRRNYDLYKIAVARITRKTIRENNIPNIDLIEQGKYSLDHKYSQLEGFKNNIAPYIIGSLYNLEVISHKENCSKQEDCSITIIELLESLKLL